MQKRPAGRRHDQFVSGPVKGERREERRCVRRYDSGGNRRADPQGAPGFGPADRLPDRGAAVKQRRVCAVAFGTVRSAGSGICPKAAGADRGNVCGGNLRHSPAGGAGLRGGGAWQ